MAKKQYSIKEGNNPKNVKQGIMGIVQLIVVASIAYSTAVIVLGTEGYIAKALVVPQALWAVCLLIKRFTN